MLAMWRTAEPETNANRVVLSVDGVHWTPRLEEALFASRNPWSAGQTRTAVLWVRNDARVRADLELQVVTTGGQDLARSGLLEVSAAVGDGKARQRLDVERD